MWRELVGVKVVGNIHEHFVDGVHNDILRCDVLHVDLVDTGTVFHVIGHSRRSDNKVDFQFRVFLQLRKQIGGAFQFVPRRIVPTAIIGLLNALFYFKQTSAP